MEGKIIDINSKYFCIGDRIKYSGETGTVIDPCAIPSLRDPIGKEQVNLCTVEWDRSDVKMGNPGNQGGLVWGKNISISLPSEKGYMLFYIK